MKHKDPTNPRTWLLRARANLTLAEKGGRLKGVAYEDLCFNAHQGEKVLQCLACDLEFPKAQCYSALEMCVMTVLSFSVKEVRACKFAYVCD